MGLSWEVFLGGWDQLGRVLDLGRSQAGSASPVPSRFSCVRPFVTTGTFNPWDFPGKNTREGCHALLQGCS